MAKAPKHEGVLRHLNILLVAGPKDHGPGEHDYPRWQKEWAPLMSKAENVSITTAFGWPKAEDWNGVDLAVFYLKTKWTASQLSDIKAIQDRGAGVVTTAGAVFRLYADAVKSAVVVSSASVALLVLSFTFETVMMRRRFASSARNEPIW